MLNTRTAARQRPNFRRTAVFAVVSMLAACASTRSVAPADDGAPSWEIRDVDELVTFALFDPVAAGVQLPNGLRFLRADEVPIPFVQEYVAQRPDVGGWAFSFFEFTRESAFLVDGRGPSLPGDAAIALWFAPVDASALVAAIAGEPLSQAILDASGSVVGLGFWIPDRAFVAYMRDKGHHAEYAEASLAKDDTGGYRGALRADALSVQVSARPEGNAETETVSETQVLFSPLAGPSRAVVIAASNPSNQVCAAEWTFAGSHALGGALRIGPTFRTTYADPLTGRAFRIGRSE